MSLFEDDCSSNSISNSLIKLFEQPQNILDSLTIDCEGIKNLDENALSTGANFTFDYDSVEETLLNSTDKCALYRYMFGFATYPMSKEEADYPLAYGVLAYKNAVQVTMMLASFYQPQNEFCIAVSKNANTEFKILMDSLAECYPNIHVMHVGDVKWGGYEIIHSVYKCLEFLATLRTEWKYFQYLSGVDVPLRTNLEMVRIFKAMHGAVNMEVKEFQLERLRKKNISDSPLPLFKSSLSALVPRQAAEKIANSPKARGLLSFLEGTYIPDESFWASALGNPPQLTVKGGFDAHEFLRYKKAHPRDGQKKSRVLAENLFPRWRYYVSRFQQWGRPCFGKLVSASCAFGVESVPILLRQPHFVAHKLYIDYQPAAFICMLKEHKRRSLSPVDFNATVYSTLPQVELSRGVSYDKLTHPEWIL